MKRATLSTLVTLTVLAVVQFAVHAADDNADANNGAQNAAGGRGGRGPAGFGGAGAFGGFGGRRNTTDMISRFLGVDVEDPKGKPKLDALPLGPEKRFVNDVPVGGVDLPGSTGPGWKMESIFKLSEEQQKAVDALREEYEKEKAKQDATVAEQLKAIAENVKKFRTTYEEKANAILTGDDKAKKEKLDALAKETSQKLSHSVAEELPKYDLNDAGQGMALARALREDSGKIYADAETKTLEQIPDESKDHVKEILKDQSTGRDRIGQFMAGRPGAGGGGGAAAGRGQNGRARRNGGAAGGDAVKPPRPPEQAEGNF